MTVAVDFREGDKIMYEIGDKVIYQGVDEKVYKKHGVVKSIEEKHGKPQLTVELENGETFTAPIDDWSREFSNACISTNSVVRNAMAVAAKNAVTNAKDSDIAKVKSLFEEAIRKIEQARDILKADKEFPFAQAIFKNALYELNNGMKELWRFKE